MDANTIIKLKEFPVIIAIMMLFIPIVFRMTPRHSDIDTTMIYSHLTEKHVDEAVDWLVF